jgi:hypothetical protein
MFLTRTFSISLSGLLFYFLAFQVSAELTCLEDPLANLMQVAYLEDDGYRPLSADEDGVSADDDFVPKSDESSEHWRPEQQSNDCNQSSLTQSEDRGYRPLNYGSSKQRSSSHDHGQSYMPNWGSGYRRNYPSYGAPAHPGGAGNIWTQGGYPRFNEPPYIPGYGVMPYSFGGGVPAP